MNNLLDGQRFSELEKKFRNTGISVNCKPVEIISDDELKELRNYYDFMIDYLTCSKDQIIIINYIMSRSSVDNMIFNRSFKSCD